MHRPARSALTILLMAVAAGCAVTPPLGPTTMYLAARSPAPGASASADPAKVSAAKALSAARVVSGRVLDPDGNVVSGVLVRAHIVSQGGNNVVSNNGGAIVSQGGSNYRATRRLLAADLETRTDREGRFVLGNPDGAKVNVEAVYSEGLKAFVANASSAAPVELKLAPTGSIGGQVTAPGQKAMKNFEGIDVFIPGTSYAAKADKLGNFRMTGLPPGTFELVAMRRGLGEARRQDVVVRSKETTSVPDLQLAIDPPQVTALEPANGGVGAEITIRGLRFGADTGERVQVTFGGALASSVEVVDNQTLKAVVPPVAGSGEVQVMVGGVPTTGGKPFTVLKSLTLLDGATYLRPGEKARFRTMAVSRDGEPELAPAIAWQASGPLTVEQGEVVAKALGKGIVTIRSGTVESTADVHVVPATDGPLLVSLSNPSAVYNLVTFKATEGPYALLGASNGGIAVDPQGVVYLTNSNAIRKRTLDGTVRLVAGPAEYLGGDFADGTGINARFDQPSGMVLDAAGNLYVADSGNHRIRKITPEGVVTTLAGREAPGYVDGQGAAAAFDQPLHLAIDRAGLLYVWDANNHVIRTVAADGTVKTLAGRPPGEPFDYQRDFVDGPGADARFDTVSALAFGPDDALYALEPWNNAVRRIAKDGTTSTYQGSRPPDPLAPSPDPSASPSLVPTSGPTPAFGSTWPATGNVAAPGNPTALVVLPDGALLIADSTYRLLRVERDGTLVHLAGELRKGTNQGEYGLVDGPAKKARISNVGAMVGLPDGDVLLSDGGSLRRLRLR